MASRAHATNRHASHRAHEEQGHGWDKHRVAQNRRVALKTKGHGKKQQPNVCSLFTDRRFRIRTELFGRPMAAEQAFHWNAEYPSKASSLFVSLCVLLFCEVACCINWVMVMLEFVTDGGRGFGQRLSG